MQVDAIVFCGKSSFDDPLLEYMREKTQQHTVTNKSLIKIGDKELLRYIVEALHKSGSIRDIYLAGITKDQIEFDFPVTYLEISSEMPLVDKVDYWIKKYLEPKGPLSELVILVNGDIPAVTPESISWFIEECKKQKADFHYSVVEKEEMEKQFPNSGRTFARLKDGSFCGADIFGIDPTTIDLHKEKIRELQKRRKSFIRQAFFVSPIKAIRVILHKATLEEVGQLAGKALKMKVHLIKAPYAEIAMDIDKPQQFDQLQSYLQG
ncbi:MAG: cytidylyltransferase domain-containing protein [Candidatus Heimdallarchaeaceae archaeon]